MKLRVDDVFFYKGSVYKVLERPINTNSHFVEYIGTLPGEQTGSLIGISCATNRVESDMFYLIYRQVNIAPLKKIKPHSL